LTTCLSAQPGMLCTHHSAKTTLKEERQRIISAAQDKYRMPDRGSNLFYNNGVTDVISIVDPEA
jgi:hypothetical protein